MDGSVSWDERDKDGNKFQLPEYNKYVYIYSLDVKCLLYIGSAMQCIYLPELRMFACRETEVVCVTPVLQF